MRHAYLILAHEKEEVLRELIKAIDDPRNDVFIHIDAKSSFSGADLKTKFSNLIVLQERIDARWGDFSLVEAELALMETAAKKNMYSRYHLISGVDYPLKSQNYIHDLCDIKADIEFIGIAQNVDDRELKWRSQHYFLFSREFKTNSIFKRALRRGYASLQSLINYRRCKGLEVKKGSQWWSVTDDFIRFVLSKKEYIRRNFKNSYCPDEMFIQTLCWNSSFRGKLFDMNDEFRGCLRYIPWENGVLRNFREVDFMNMHESEAIFGRKFSFDDIIKYNQ